MPAHPEGEPTIEGSGACSWLTRHRRAGINVHRDRCELSESDSALRTLLLLPVPLLPQLPQLPQLPLLPLLLVVVWVLLLLEAPP